MINGNAMNPRAFPNSFIIWLALCCLLVFCMSIVGGAVRLTGSGLSIVDWRPIGGIIPPIGDAQWRAAFDAYRQFPEFRLLRPDTTIADFRFIFWMEYAHRLLGRVIGAVFFIPFCVFLYRRIIPRALAARLWLIFALGAAQGLLGWYMVQSGLAETARVSHYRLLAHFMLAAVIYALLLRALVGCAMQMNIGDIHSGNPFPRAIRASGCIALIVIGLMLASGALVAGTSAGKIYNTWPQMGDGWLPPQVFAMQPFWRNVTDNPVAIQFIHRWLAFAAAFIIGLFAVQHLRVVTKLRGQKLARGVGIGLLGALGVQIALGVAALLTRVPAVLGVAHQAGAMMVLTLVVVAASLHWPGFARRDE